MKSLSGAKVTIGMKMVVLNIRQWLLNDEGRVGEYDGEMMDECGTANSSATSLDFLLSKSCLANDTGQERARGVFRRL